MFKKEFGGIRPRSRHLLTFPSQAEEARNLKAYGELPETARINETAVDMANEGEADDSCAFEFDEI